MPKKLSAVLTLLLTLASAQVWAEWVQVSESREIYLLVDPSTVRAEEQFRRLWVLYNYKQTGPVGLRSARAFEEYDCKEARQRPLSVAFFSEPMGDGVVLANHWRPGEWAYIAPDSVTGRVLKIVCAI